MPRTEYGVIGSRTLVQILSPPGNHRGPEIFWSKRKKEDRRFQGIGFRGGDAFQVITDTLSRGVGKQGKLFIAKLANFLPFRIGLLFKLRCFRRDLRHGERQFQGGFTAGEHPIQRVIIGSRNGIIFMIMTTGTGDRQPQESARHRIDLVVNNVVDIVIIHSPECQESHRR